MGDIGEFTPLADGRVRKMLSDVNIGAKHEGPLFTVVTYPGIGTPCGTRVYFRGMEITDLVGFKHTVDYGNPNEVVTTTIELKIGGMQVETRLIGGDRTAGAVQATPDDQG